jgi:hypothetical protein
MDTKKIIIQIVAILSLKKEDDEIISIVASKIKNLGGYATHFLSFVEKNFNNTNLKYLSSYSKFLELLHMFKIAILEEHPVDQKARTLTDKTLNFFRQLDCEIKCNPNLTIYNDAVTEVILKRFSSYELNVLKKIVRGNTSREKRKNLHSIATHNPVLLLDRIEKIMQAERETELAYIAQVKKDAELIENSSLLELLKNKAPDDNLSFK